MTDVMLAYIGVVIPVALLLILEELKAIRLALAPKEASNG